MAAEESYESAAAAVVDELVEAAALFEPNVPDALPSIGGVITYPARWMRLRSGAVRRPVFLVVTSSRIILLRARLRLGGFRLGEEVESWARSDVVVQAVAVAVWGGQSPPWPALRITSGTEPLAELKPRAMTSSTTRVYDRLIGRVAR